MKRFFAKIGHFFWSWGFLKFILGVVALIILFYVEEDWRGARAWAATKAEWEAKGETFDYNKFIPPPVPDDQNLAAIPLFKQEMVKNYDGSLAPVQVALNHALRDDLPSLELPRTGYSRTGELPDMAKIQKTLASDYAMAFKNAKPPDDTLEQFNAIYPFLADFLAAAATHPVFRLNMDYIVSPPFDRPLGPVVKPIALSHILIVHAILALDHHQGDLALQDIKINHELACGAKRDPTLVGGLVSIGIMAINQAAIYDGLALHAWNDAQLAELDQTLKPNNFLADFQFSMRCEIAQSIASIDYLQHESRSVRNRLIAESESDVPFIVLFEPPCPNGWWDENKRRMATYVLSSLAGVDPQKRLVFPKVSLDLQHQIDEANARWDAYAPWKILANVVAGPITKAVSKFAQAQVLVDQTRIACALERYRLAQGVYPGALDALAPSYIDEVPRDIMNGQLFHYQLRADGTYLLYSVGWNQVDDGGKVVYRTDVPAAIDYEQGDWVWPTPKYNH